MLKAFSRARALVTSLRTDDEGANAVEYALVLGLVAIALVVAAIGLTPILETFVEEIGTWMDAQGVS